MKNDTVEQKSVFTTMTEKGVDIMKNYINTKLSKTLPLIEQAIAIEKQLIEGNTKYYEGYRDALKHIFKIVSEFKYKDDCIERQRR